MIDVARKTKATKILDDTMGTMERVLGRTGFDPNGKKPSTFRLHSPILKRGDDRTYMAATDRMWVFVNTYAPESGENKLHTHTNEDHTFIVLQGKARFYGPNGEEALLGRNEGIMLPRGTLYTFRAVDGPLILLRIGCLVDAAKSPWGRVDANGTALLGNAKDNGQIETIIDPNAYFE